MRRNEYKKKLVDYFLKNLKKGYTDESLKWALVNQGYSRTVVDEALKEAHMELAARAPILKEKPKINYEVLDDNDNPISVKKPWWKRLFG